MWLRPVISIRGFSWAQWPADAISWCRLLGRAVVLSRSLGIICCRFYFFGFLWVSSRICLTEGVTWTCDLQAGSTGERPFCKSYTQTAGWLDYFLLQWFNCQNQPKLLLSCPWFLAHLSLNLRKVLFFLLQRTTVLCPLLWRFLSPFSSPSGKARVCFHFGFLSEISPIFVVGVWESHWLVFCIRGVGKRPDRSVMVDAGKWRCPESLALLVVGKSR